MTVASKAQIGSVAIVLCMAVLSSAHAADGIAMVGAGAKNTEGVLQPEEVKKSASTAQASEIGAATDELFAKQRTSVAVRPRMIDGEQASRSYERYLKSFEYEIPEAFDTGTQTQK